MRRRDRAARLRAELKKLEAFRGDARIFVDALENRMPSTFASIVCEDIDDAPATPDEEVRQLADSVLRESLLGALVQYEQALKARLEEVSRKKLVV
jgi:hypothetical protein